MPNDVTLILSFIRRGGLFDFNNLFNLKNLFNLFRKLFNNFKKKCDRRGGFFKSNIDNKDYYNVFLKNIN